MALDLFAHLTQSIAEPVNAWLREHEAEPDAALAPPTRKGTGDLTLACHRYARVFRKAPQMIAADLIPVVTAHPLVQSAEAAAGFLNLRLDWAAVGQQTVEWALSPDDVPQCTRTLRV